MRIATYNLGWASGGRPIVEGITLEVKSGETLGLIGPNGSGKSTLLRLLAGIAPRPQGHVTLEGEDLRRMKRRDIARRIAFVEQQADTAEALRVRDAVALGRTPWLSPLAPFGAADAAICAKALAHVGMAQMADRSWSTLSGGERQRVHIARALAQRPQVMLLDEPTNHLDIHHQLALLRLISDLPVTVVIALHDLNQAMGCDRLAVMEGGRLAAIGPPAEVLTQTRLGRIFRVGGRALHDPTDGATQFRFHCLEDPL
ncbi:ABC transporter ATP-binding protein [Gemmobacter serpentinus]|uniref:ABC transporter ATP-binding protein n=1 Tax=Gemmobacter serpentinus TaxID=2652247 RepID=UPI00124E5DF3|nr:ABC transporter ATP-binding protein [Gemmobacter serpentinus]